MSVIRNTARLVTIYMNKNKNKKIVVLVENGMLVAVRANFQDNIDVEEMELEDPDTKEKSVKVVFNP